jgi:type I restriction enzyme S subunit
MSQTVLLGDICKYITDKIAVGEISLGDYVSTENLLPEKGGLSLASNLPQAGKVTRYKIGDVLVSNIRPYFKKICIARHNGGASNDVLVFRPTTNGLDSQYLFYVLADDRFFNYSTASSGGSKMPRGDKAQIMKYPVRVPGLEEQKKIVDILGAIDEKIEVNRRMNETLEQMGQALFKHYFITNPESKGWGMVVVGKKIHPRRGKSLQSRDMKEGAVPVISGGLQPAGHHNVANTMAPVITVSASGANAGFVRLWGINVWSADSSFIDSSVTENVYFYYVLLKLSQNKIYGMQTGAAQPHIYPSHLELLEMPNAPAEQMTNFRTEATLLFQQIARNVEEVQTLTALRDTLLPRLISGKIKI